MSYIVKNCPGIYSIGASNMKCSKHSGDCDRVTDCVIKKVLELCEQFDNDYDCNCGFKISAEFDIEEV